MAVLLTVILIGAFVLLVGGTLLVRARRGIDLEPPHPGILVDESDREEADRAAEERAERGRSPATTLEPQGPGVTEQVEEALGQQVDEALAGVGLAPAEVAPTDVVPEVAERPRLRDRLTRARALLAGYVGSLLSRSSIDAEAWEELEEALIRADVGVNTTAEVLGQVRERIRAESLTTPEELVDALKAQLVAELSSGDHSLHLEAGTTNVWLFVGVNGVGKTTTIGKVGLRMSGDGHRVVMAAGDTFRAAAAEQLELWSHRVGADLVRGAEGGDPGAVVYDAVQRAASRGADLVLADTAGRLHTKVNLMEELKKVRRVAGRPPGVVTEVFLVLDATTGQNGLTQAREFASAVEVTGVVLTKLDGTAKGGIVLAIQSELGLPVKLVGVGEGPGDLVDFDPEEFVEALFA